MLHHRSILLAVVLCACGPTPPDPDGGLDAPILLDVPADAGTDAPPASPFCRPCRRDADCGDGAFCTLFGDGHWACTVGCSVDAECSGLSLAATCAAEEPGFPLGCRPTSGSCLVSAAGSACTDACSGTFDVCAEPEPGLGRYCTTECESDADCPMGLRRCAVHEGMRVCVRDPASGPERCAALLEAEPPEPCATDGDCGGGRCLQTRSGRGCFAVPTAGACAPGQSAVLHLGSPVCVPDARDPSSLALPDCACLARDGGLLEEAAALAGRDPCAMHFPHALLDAFPTELTHDVARLSAIDGAHSDWLAPPALADALSSSIDGAGSDPLATLLALAPRADLMTPSSVSAPVASDAAAALRALAVAAGGSPDDVVIAAALAGLSADADAAMASLFLAVEHALRARESAIAAYDETERRVLFDAPSGLFLPGTARTSVTRTLVGAMRGDVDVSAMASAAAEILAAADGVARAGGTGLAPLRIETPRGSIVLGGASDDVLTIEAALLVLDVGGDDRYVGPVGGTASIENGVSVVLDLGGSDDYGYLEVAAAGDEGPPGHARLPSDAGARAAPAGGYGPYSLSMASRQGAGRLGIGVAIDRGAQDDERRSLRMSQGYGALGVGILFDEGGDDAYLGEAGVQGAAVAGIGLLIDGGGTDRYVTYHASQGFAFSRGLGVLHDVAGDDDYLAHPSDVLYFSPQSPGASNSSFAQGVGFGRRDDAGGTYMSGGIGILRDGAGDDRYRCGIFCQASAYWYGVGMLLEGGGHDHYDGEWYCQAGDAHFAVAVLLDAAGNDTFNETAIRRNASVGGGHDFSSAWLIDLRGDDVFRAPNLALGVGHAGGFAAFVDGDGTDAYDVASDLSLGSASIETPGDPARRMSGTVGLFVDRGGVDTYVRPTVVPVANDAAWSQSAHTGESEAGAGIDRATGTLGAGLE